MQKTYRVDGMTCGSCGQSVTKAIQALSGDATVNVDLEQRTVTVDGLDDDDAIARAVTDAGFEYGGPS
jgi:copper chaperone